MPASEKNLTDLFIVTLKDTYHAEKQLLKALPKMAKARPTPTGFARPSKPTGTRLRLRSNVWRRSSKFAGCGRVQRPATLFLA